MIFLGRGVLFVGKMVGKPLGMVLGTLNNQHLIYTLHLISRGYLLGIYPFKGSL